MTRNQLFIKYELLILSILYHKDCFGKEISNEIQIQSDGLFNIKLGSIYTTLYNLEKKGYVDYQERKTGKRQLVKVYHLNEKGIVYYKNIVQQYKLEKQMIEKFI